MGQIASSNRNPKREQGLNCWPRLRFGLRSYLFRQLANLRLGIRRRSQSAQKAAGVEYPQPPQPSVPVPPDCKTFSKEFDRSGLCPAGLSLIIGNGELWNGRKRLFPMDNSSKGHLTQGSRSKDAKVAKENV
jgi:hypothetical protein